MQTEMKIGIVTGFLVLKKFYAAYLTYYMQNKRSLQDKIKDDHEKN